MAGETLYDLRALSFLTLGMDSIGMEELLFSASSYWLLAAGKILNRQPGPDQARRASGQLVAFELCPPPIRLIIASVRVDFYS
jgi:hypothetical protein